MKDTPDSGSPALASEALIREHAELTRTVQCLKREITLKDDVLHQKNLALDALTYVWCDGGCQKGVYRYLHSELTEAMVEAAERNTARLRRWWTNRQGRTN